MKKRSLSLLLCLAMVVALLPTTALAVGDPVTIGGMALNALNCYYTNGANGAPGRVSSTATTGWNAYFHVDGNIPTLELNGLVLTGYAGDHGVHLRCEDPSTTEARLVLNGTSTISVSGTGIDNTKASAGFYALGMGGDKNLTVSGTGSLRATNSNGHGINVNGFNLIAAGGTLTGNGAGTDGNGVTVGFDGFMNDKMTVSGGTVSGTSAKGGGVSVMGALTVSAGKLAGTGSVAGLAVNGGVGATISGGEVTVAMNASSVAINNAGGIKVVSGITVSGGSVTVNGNYAQHGIVANTCIVNGGVVRTSGSAYTGIYTVFELTLAGGVVQASAGDQALYAGRTFSINYPRHYEITASAEESGADPEPFDQTGPQLDRYRYFRIEPTELRIAGIPLNLASCYYVNGANGAPGRTYETEPTGGAWNARYAEVNGAPVLTLRNLRAQGVDSSPGVYSEGSLDIVLEGASSVSGCAGSMANYMAVDVHGDLAVTGAGGSLSADTADSYEAPALYVQEDLTLGAGVTVTGTSGRDVGVLVTGTLTLAGAGASVAGHSRRSSDPRENMNGVRAGSVVFSAPATLTASAVAVPAVKNMTVTTSGFPDPPGFAVTASASPDGANPTVRHNAYTYSADNKYLRIEPVTYAITYDANGGSGTMPDGAAMRGVAFRLPVCAFTAPANMRFKEWAIGTLDGTTVRAGDSYTFAAATTVYAIWEDAPASPVATNTVASTGGNAYAGNPYTGSGTPDPDGALTFTIQAPCAKLVSVSVDGAQLIKGKDYTPSCGSTIVTLTPAFLASCPDGAHSIRAQFTDGRYDGAFTTPLAAATATTALPDLPATGGAPWWVRLLMANQ